MSKTALWIAIAIIAAAIIVWGINRNGDNGLGPKESPGSSPTASPSPSPTAGRGGSVTITYDQAIKQYGGKIIQFDINC